MVGRDSRSREPRGYPPRLASVLGRHADSVAGRARLCRNSFEKNKRGPELRVVAQDPQ